MSKKIETRNSYKIFSLSSKITEIFYLSRSQVSPQGSCNHLSVMAPSSSGADLDPVMLIAPGHLPVSE